MLKLKIRIRVRGCAESDKISNLELFFSARCISMKVHACISFIGNHPSTFHLRNHINMTISLLLLRSKTCQLFLGSSLRYCKHKNYSFSQQGPRSTGDCISGPRQIPVVLWGRSAYIMRALPQWVYHTSGRCAPPHHHGSWVSELPSTARARPLDLTLRVVRFPAPGTPHTQKPEQSRRTIGAQRCSSTGYTHAVRYTRHRYYSPGEGGAREKHDSYHITALQHHFSRLL